ncbi:LLM class flavin-dependent oxidoreductase [Nocardioides alcanivorans]|uniref:LLM class flavin-dependent oxidoreductase n=1 Tax=Nocardioides alcanivorans TaxID=2897352 RepID=UPI001F28FF92|nr:LLM class flavin-dependent oxidoreductase [Nocardioides alcanivorans]
MRISLMFAGGGGMTVRDMVDLAVEAEAAGADGVFLPEAWRSGFVTITAIAAATERIEIGPYVVNAHAHSPLFTGIAAVDLDEFSNGRLVLGVGSGNKVTNERYQGIPVVKPLAKMRDYVAVLHRVTRAGRGTRVDHDGTMHSTSGWHAQVQPVRPDLPVVLAATSPRMTRMAGEVADGVALGSLLGVEHIRQLLRDELVGVDADFRVMASAFVAVHEDREVARDAARSAVVNLFAGKPHPHYDSLLRQQGHANVADAIIDAVAADDILAAHRAVSDEVLNALTICGTVGDCIAGIDRYRGVVSDLILVNASGMRYQEGDEAVGNEGSELVRSFDPIMDLLRALRSGGRSG